MVSQIWCYWDPKGNADNTTDASLSFCHLTWLQPQIFQFKIISLASSRKSPKTLSATLMILKIYAHENHTALCSQSTDTSSAVLSLYHVYACAFHDSKHHSPLMFVRLVILTTMRNCIELFLMLISNDLLIFSMAVLLLTLGLLIREGVCSEAVFHVTCTRYLLTGEKLDLCIFKLIYRVLF